MLKDVIDQVELGGALITACKLEAEVGSVYKMDRRQVDMGRPSAGCCTRPFAEYTLTGTRSAK